MPYPFSLAKPGGYAPGDVPTHSELNKIDEQAAAGADGAVWTDAAMFANWPYTFTDALGGRALLYNPSLKEFFSFNSGLPPVGFRARNPFTTRTALTIPADQGLDLMTSSGMNAAYNPTNGMMLLSGDCNSATVNRYRTSINGTTWTTRVSSIPSSTLGPTCVLWCGAPLNRWLATSDRGVVWSGLAETSSDGIAWTQSVLSDSLPQRFAAFSPTLPMILAVPATGAAANYHSSSTGLSGSWNTLPSPVVFHSIFWSAYQGRFFAAGQAPANANVYTSVNGISWTLVSSYPGATARRWFEWNRLIGFATNSGEIVASLNGGQNWDIIAAVPASSCLALGANQMMTSSGSTHAATIRWGF